MIHKLNITIEMVIFEMLIGLYMTVEDYTNNVKEFFLLNY
jgi:hypothetical protein